MSRVSRLIADIPKGATGWWQAVRRWWPWRARSIGERGEDLAARALKRNGYRILRRNVRVRHGELDILARDGNVLVFVEVKTRRCSTAANAQCDPTEQVTPQKRDKLTQVALRLRKQNGWLEQPSRFDVVAVVLPDDGPPDIRIYKNAFESTGAGQFF